jgi:hypothetical protein
MWGCSESTIHRRKKEAIELCEPMVREAEERIIEMRKVGAEVREV